MNITSAFIWNPSKRKEQTPKLPLISRASKNQDLKSLCSAESLGYWTRKSLKRLFQPSASVPAPLSISSTFPEKKNLDQNTIKSSTNVSRSWIHISFSARNCCKRTKGCNRKTSRIHWEKIERKNTNKLGEWSNGIFSNDTHFCPRAVPRILSHCVVWSIPNFLFNCLDGFCAITRCKVSNLFPFFAEFHNCFIFILFL